MSDVASRGGGSTDDGGAVQPGSVTISHSQGVQLVFGGSGTQVNGFGAGTAAGPAADEFRSDVLALLAAVDEWACRSGLPPHLAPGADVLRMARTVRLLGRVRRPQDGQRDRGRDRAAGRDQVYALPAEHDKRAEEPPLPWLQVAAGHDRLVVLADPGMGKSWLLRLEAHRLAVAALTRLTEPTTAVGEVAVPVPVRADVLAAAPGATLAEAVAACLVSQGLLARRSAGLMADLIAAGGAVLLVDALDEVPREAVAAGGQAPRKRLEDLLRQWAERCPGRARVVVASRLAGYTGPPVPGAREAELLPFTPADIDVAAGAWELPAPAAGWLRERLGDPAVAGMARVPLLLALACSLAAEPDGRPEGLPRDRAGLYEAVVWQFLSGAHRAAEHGGSASTLDASGREDLLRVLTHVAFAFASTDRGWVDRMPRRDLLDAIRGAGNALTDLGASPAAVLDRLSGQAGILVPAGNPAAAAQDYVFLHRTIAEYLVARHLRELRAGPRMDIVAAHQWFDPDWAEVFPMLGGLLAATDPDGARALVSWFLGQRPDPLHYAFRTALRILGDAPDLGRLLTSSQERDLRRKTTRLFTSDGTRELISRTLAAASTWPGPVTTVVTTLVGSREWGVDNAATRALEGRDVPEVNAALIARLTDRDALIARFTDREARVRVRTAVVHALTEHEAPEVTAALVASLADRDENVRVAAASALVGRDAPEVIAPLVARLTDKNWRVRAAAAEALAGQHAPQVTAALIACLADKHARVRLAAAKNLRWRDTPEVTAALVGCLTDQASFVRLAVAKALTGWEAPEVAGALNTLIALLADKEEYIRAAAVAALTARDSADVTAALIGCLTDNAERVRVATVRALAEQEASAVTAALVDRLGDPNWQVRLAAARALAGRRTPEVTAALLTLLDGLVDKEEFTRAQAATALRGLDAPEVTTVLLSLLNRQQRWVRVAATRALAERDAPEVTAALIANLTDEDEPVRVAAAAALVRQDAAKVTTILLAFLASQDPWVRGEAAWALTGQDAPEVTAALLARLADGNRWVRIAAVRALAWRDTPEVTVALLARLADGNRWVRIAAVEALAWRDTPEVTAALLARLADRAWSVGYEARQALEGRDDAAILLHLTRPGIRVAWPGPLQGRFYQACVIADGAYLRIPPADRARIRRRLARITRRA